MHKLFGPMGFKIVSIATLISTIGGLLSLSFLSPRSSAAMAEDGLLPPSLFHKNRFEAPFLSIILSMSLASLVTLGGNFIQLAAISVISRFAQYISTILALFIFNRKKLLTPFQNRWKLLIPLFSLGGIGYLLTQANLQELLFGFGGLLLGIPLYFLYYFPKKRSADKIPSL
jgi:amino acid transporter